MGRLGTAEEIASLLVYLASDEVGQTHYVHEVLWLLICSRHL